MIAITNAIKYKIEMLTTRAVEYSYDLTLISLITKESENFLHFDSM